MNEVQIILRSKPLQVPTVELARLQVKMVRVEMVEVSDVRLLVRKLSSSFIAAVASKFLYDHYTD